MSRARVTGVFMLKKVLIIFVALVVLFFVVGFVLPKDFAAERSLQIDASPAVVFNHVNTLPKNEAWSPWKFKDPTVKITYAGTSSAGKGASYSWTSEKSGAGTLTITESDRPKKIVNSIDFGEQGPATGIWLFEPAAEGTKVTWRLEGEAQNVIGRYFGVMMDSMVGPDFELGLKRLKEAAEKG